MKKNLLIVIFSITCAYSFAQVVETVYNVEALLYVKKAIETPDKGMLIIANERVSGDETRTILIKTNRNGELLWVKNIGLLPEGLFSLTIAQSKYTYISGRSSKYGVGSSFVLMLDECYNLKWIKMFGNNFDDYNFVRDQVITDKNELVIAINILDDERITVIKLDIEGNELWRSNFLPNGFDAQIGRNYGNASVYNIMQTKDKGFLIGCDIYIEDYIINDYPIKTFILKMDSLGNREWLYAFGVDSNRMHQDPMPVELADSSFLVLCNHLYYPGVGPYWAASYAYKVDKNGHLLWHKYIGNTLESRYLKGAVSVSDTSIVVLAGVGSYSVPDSFRLKFMLIDTAGELLAEATYGDNYNLILQSLTKASDNKVIATALNRETNNTSSYVIRLHSDLSIDTFNNDYTEYDTQCNHQITTGYIPFDTAVNIVAIAGKEVEILHYPNPAKEYMYFEVKDLDNFAYNIAVYDFRGRLVFSEKNISEKRFKLNTSSYAHSIYFYKLNFGGTNVAEGSFIKE